MSATEQEKKVEQQHPKDGDKAVAGKPITDKADNVKSKTETDRLASKAMRFTTDKDQAFTIVTDKGDVQDKRKIASADLPEKLHLPTDKSQMLQFHKNEDGSDYQTTTKDGKVTKVDYPKPPGGSSDVEYGPDGKPSAVHKHNPDGSETSYEKDAHGQWHKKQKMMGLTTSDETLPPGTEVKVQQERDKHPGQIDVDSPLTLGGKERHESQLTTGKEVQKDAPSPLPPMQDLHIHKNSDGSSYDTQTNHDGKVTRVDYPTPPGGSADVSYGPDGKPNSVHVHNPNGSETSYEKDAHGQWHKKGKMFGVTTSDETLPPGADIRVQQEGEKNPGQIDVSWGYPIGGRVHHDGYPTNGKAEHQEYPPARPEPPISHEKLPGQTDNAQAGLVERIFDAAVRPHPKDKHFDEHDHLWHSNKGNAVVEPPSVQSYGLAGALHTADLNNYNAWRIAHGMKPVEGEREMGSEPGKLERILDAAVRPHPKDKHFDEQDHLWHSNKGNGVVEPPSVESYGLAGALHTADLNNYNAWRIEHGMKPVEGERDLGSEPVERKSHTGGVKEDHQGGSDHYSSDYDKPKHKTHHGGTGETHKQHHPKQGGASGSDQNYPWIGRSNIPDIPGHPELSIGYVDIEVPKGNWSGRVQAKRADGTPIHLTGHLEKDARGHELFVVDSVNGHPVPKHLKKDFVIPLHDSAPKNH